MQNFNASNFQIGKGITMTHSGSTSNKRMVTVFHTFQSAMKQDRDSLTGSEMKSDRR